MINSAAISYRRIKRYADAAAMSSVDPASILEKAINMGEKDREDYIKRFVSQHGVRDTFSLVKNIVNSVVSKKTTAQLYEGFRNNQNKESEQPLSSRDTSSSSKIKHLLNKAGDWSVLLTFFLMWAAVSTSDYHSLHLKQPNADAELRAFLLTSGSAFMAWVFKKLASLFK